MKTLTKAFFNWRRRSTNDPEVSQIPGNRWAMKLRLPHALARVAFTALCLFSVTQALAQTGAALDFDGNDNVVNVPSTATLVSYGSTNALTVEYWVKPDATLNYVPTPAQPQAFEPLVSKRWNSNVAGILIDKLTAAGVHTHWLRFNTGWERVDVSYPVNTWSHVALTYEAGSGMNVYVNGVLVGSNPVNAQLVVSAAPLQLGGETVVYNYKYRGQMDEFRMWDRALDAAELNAQKDCEISGSEPGLLAYYQFNEGIAAGINLGVTALPDVSGNGHTGTLQNFALNGANSNWVGPGGIATDDEAPSIDCAQPAVAANSLVNGSFENGTVHDQFGSQNWNVFGSAFAVDQNVLGSADDGQFFMKTFGGNSGLFQDVAVQGGDQITATIYIQNASFDPMNQVGGGQLKLEWLGVPGLETSPVVTALSAAAQDMWEQVTINTTVPAGATGVRIVAACNQPVGGAVMFDNASLIINGGGGLAGDITVDNEPGTCGATVTPALPSHSDNCGVASITNDFTGTDDATGFYPIGTTTVTWTVTDNGGLTSTCSIDVTVNDTETPTIACNSGQPAPNLLANNSFEANGGHDATGATDWTHFADAWGGVRVFDQNVNGAAQDGGFFIKMFGPNSGLFQDVAVQGGDQITASIYVQNASFDPMNQVGGGQLKLEWIGVPGLETSPVITALGPQDVWQLTTITTTAPAGATGVRMVAACNQPVGGAVMFDNASITINGVTNFVLDNDPGVCGAAVEFENTASDNCAFTVSQPSGLASGSVFPVGTTTNTFTVTDASGNEASCSFDVTVNDVEAPSIDCTAPAVAANSLINGSFENGTVHDQFGSQNWNVFGSAFAVDQNVLGSADDGQFFMKTFGGNSGLFQDVAVNGGDQITATIYIQNASFDPMNQVGGGQLKLEWLGVPGLETSPVVTALSPAAQDMWEQVTINTTVPAGATGVRIVAACNQPVGGAVMFDNASLIINGGGGLAGDITVSNDAGECGATATPAVPSNGDNCGVASITNDFTGTDDATGFYPIGTTTVTWTVTDDAGLTASCSVDVTVNDTEAPVINCNSGQPAPNLLANNSFEANGGHDATGATDWTHFADAWGGVRVFDQNVNGAAQDGGFFIKMFGPNSGLFQDVAVQGGDQITASIYVQNASFDPMNQVGGGQLKLEWIGVPGLETSPVITALGPQDVWQLTTITTTAPAGATGVRMVAACNQPVGGAVMFDNASITINGVTNFVLDNDPGVCGAAVEFENTASDNCAFTVSQPSGLASGSVFPVGTTTNTFTVTDASGNEASCSFDVTVNDVEAPSIDCTAPAVAANSLINGSFENGTVHDQFGSQNWNVFGSAFAVDQNVLGSADDGQFFMKTFGGNSGLFQDVAVQGGDQITATIYIQNASFDPMNQVGGGQLKLEWLGVPGLETSPVVTALSPAAQDMWEQVTINTTVPAGATGVRIVAACNQPVGGAVMFDNASLIINGGGGLAGDITVSNDAGECGATATPAIPSNGDNCGVASITNDFTGTDDATGFYPIGTTTVTWTATDDAGNTSSCSVDVTVNDTEAPVINCNSGQPAPNLLANNSFEANGGHDATGATDWTHFADAWGGVRVFDQNVNGAAQDGGFFIKMFGPNSGLFQDVAVQGGDQITASIYVQNASFDPMNQVGGGQLKLEWIGVPGLETSPVITALGPQDVWQLTTITTTAPAGATGVRMVAACNQPVGGAVMFDNASITINGVTNFVLDNDAGVCGAAVEFVNTASDNCPGFTVAQTSGLASGSVFPVGTTTNAFTVTDASGNESSCSFDVTVNDVEAPSITCTDVVVNNDAGVCGAAVEFETPTDDNCPGATVAQTAGLASGSVFPVGTTTNTFTVTDASGNESSCSFDVTVNDVEAPSITCTGVVVDNDAGVCGATVTFETPIDDNCAGATVAQTAGLASGSVFPVGTTTNSFTVTDAAGNESSCSFDVTVNDVEAPSITCTDVVVDNDAGVCGATVTFAPNASDNCPGFTVSQLAGLASGSVFPVGTTTNYFVVIDAAGNADSCSFDVTVNDVEAPSIECADIVLTACEETATFEPIASDNCGIDSTMCSPASGSEFSAGETTVTCTVLDASGNESTCTFTVTRKAALEVELCGDQNAALGYFPEQTVSISVLGTTGGEAPYTYEWSDGQTGTVISVTPDVTTEYCVTVTDADGCSEVACHTVTVVDIRCGNYGSSSKSSASSHGNNGGGSSSSSGSGSGWGSSSSSGSGWGSSSAGRSSSNSSNSSSHSENLGSVQMCECDEESSSSYSGWGGSGSSSAGRSSSKSSKSGSSSKSSSSSSSSSGTNCRTHCVPVDKVPQRLFEGWTLGSCDAAIDFSGGDCGEPTLEGCDCEPGIANLTVQYNGASGHDIYAGPKNKINKAYASFTNVQNGDLLTVDAALIPDWELGNNVWFIVDDCNGSSSNSSSSSSSSRGKKGKKKKKKKNNSSSSASDCASKLHTSCSDELYPGFEFDNFTVVGFQNAYGQVCTSDVYAGNGASKTANEVEETFPAIVAVEDNISVFPNPFSTIFRLSIQLSDQKEVSFAVYDGVGNLVHQVANRNVMEGYYDINLENHAPGVYFVQIMVGTERHSRRIMKMN